MDSSPILKLFETRDNWANHLPPWTTNGGDLAKNA